MTPESRASDGKLSTPMTASTTCLSNEWSSSRVATPPKPSILRPSGTINIASAPTPGNHRLRKERRQSLSRSGTLGALVTQAAEVSAEKNSFLGFNHRSWIKSIVWISQWRSIQDTSLDGMLLPMVMITLLSVVLALFYEYGWWSWHPPALTTDVTVGLGGSMALLLAFRLNVCYDRFWEGRLLWGRVIQNSRSLVTTLLALEVEEEPGSEQALRKRRRAECAAGWCLAFAVALRTHLRGRSFAEDGGLCASAQQLVERDLPSVGADAFFRLSASLHPPLHALHCLRRTTTALVAERRREGVDTCELGRAIFQLTDELHAALTGCERILRTPCPPGYVGVLRCALFFFLLLLPFVLLDNGAGMVFIVIMTSFVLLGAEEVAIQLEQPFGDDRNDLPLDSFCLTLEADLLVLLDERVEGLVV